jgi:hypothetical protein
LWLKRVICIGVRLGNRDLEKGEWISLNLREDYLQQRSSNPGAAVRQSSILRSRQ